ncbi:alpha/beta-type small acid-soluble spore protein [Paenibacillus sp. NEAU-GSW1]|uniref:alpha/beta-type small acid-soluble spore protein n=1 Tax=Paenibacillus sp. NEAU-GSW1 TaxID=2682486 RepID=UPI0012E211E1|nr:alpha/beta-type small acid-soluble spore protein [Paenibacillus sp. NEAU-GSW1]MUT67701.1 small, acid-soluble spore protein, alpha/beta type [Paenibacillus sp. NEAU-GSW1]
MARRNRKLLVPEARQAMQQFKTEVMRKEGYNVNPNRPDDVKYEVAEELGITLKQGDNGDLKTEDAGHIGGRIGGSMVREMIRLAQEKLTKQ